MVVFVFIFGHEKGVLSTMKNCFIVFSCPFPVHIFKSKQVNRKFHKNFLTRRQFSNNTRVQKTGPVRIRTIDICLYRFIGRCVTSSPHARTNVSLLISCEAKIKMIQVVLIILKNVYSGLITLANRKRNSIHEPETLVPI